MVTETTAASRGSTLRATTDWSALTTWLPPRTGSMQSYARAAWPPPPSMVMVGCGHHGTGPESKEPDRDARHVVHAIDLLDAEALHEAVLDHCVTASAALLGRLEDQHRRAVEVARLSEVLSGPEQHGGVAVMTTGMHPAGDFGLVRHVRGFCDR